MYRPITEISFEQITQITGEAARNLKFTFNFVNEFSATDTWVDLTNQAKITFPKNIYVKDQKTGHLMPMGGTQPNLQIKNLFLRGDKVKISYGYWLEDGNSSVTQVFDGFISAVTSKKPIQLECEDNMWALKQIPCKRQVWPKEKSLEDLLIYLLNGTPYTVNTTSIVSIGSFIIENESVAQLLSRLRKEYHIESYFRGTELRVGLKPYLLSEARTNTFIFQQNIISDQLEFKRKGDIKLSAVVQSINTVAGGYNKQGEEKTKKEHLSVLVYNDASGVFKSIVKKKGEDLPANVEGERRTLYFPNVTTTDKLVELGIQELQKYYYEGFNGKFTTFAYPNVRLGDHVTIKDLKMPDRDGTYLVRGVEYNGGVNGHRQIIHLDYKYIQI